MNTPAVTMVAAWISADTGVGPSIASGSQVWSPSCADLPIAPTNSSTVTAVHMRGRERDLADEVQHALLRIAGEALFNTAVHSRAHQVTVTLTYATDTVALSVDDDGVGDTEHLRRVMRTASLGDLTAGRHRGLANMSSRAAELGGEPRVSGGSCGCDVGHDV